LLSLHERSSVEGSARAILRTGHPRTIIVLRKLLLTTAIMGLFVSSDTNFLFSLVPLIFSLQDTTPIGRILNRFSRDQDSIDLMVMRMLENVLNISLSLVGIIVVIAIVTPWTLIPIGVVMLIYIGVERAYRHNNRELKRIESIARSPLYAHFAETLMGLSSIRAYRAQNIFLTRHLHHLNNANSPTYLQLMTQRWLSIRVESVSAIVAFTTALLVVLQSGSISAGQAGLAVSYAISLPLSLNWMVRCTAEVESGMNSVERAKHYSDELPQEAPQKKAEDDRLQILQRSAGKAQWPSEGSVTFHNVRMRYRDGLPEVLRGVSFSIKSRERVGIVGRTGSGA
jgi:ABC-type multidrug transport system fused ATPase/permease subunit